MLACIPVWATVICRNEYARRLIGAGASGLILEKFIAADVGMALLAPVFNVFSHYSYGFYLLLIGIGGNIGSIFASRISSALHAGSEEAYGDARNMLFMLSVPNHAGFLLVTHLLGIGHVHVDLSFFALYMAASLVLSAIMLFLAERMTLAFWRRGCDPDNCVLPLLTALGDVFGTALLVIVFAVYKLIDSAGGEPTTPAVPPTLRVRALWI
ncbi:MAG: hypothetical protein BJ554DRAFT_7652 [Olpidium bornovanus]|uniref:SLC41A/MgtE integral membrane domain-containing protein n=1 Tax=Olpidium bornovanus TaxID=278681 RepID=A0A8H8A1Y3_9FUNG|nr:MAG: hypothetical protein BJ554DRAFT_7652 [Olpidium bornovanus]